MDIEESEIRDAIEMVETLQSMIDVAAERLEGLRTQCSTSAGLTQQEIRTLEGKLLKHFAKQLKIKERFEEILPQLNDIPCLRQWLRVVGLSEQAIQQICLRVSTLDSLRDRSDSELRAWLVSVREEEWKRLCRAMNRLRAYSDALNRGEAEVEIQLYWDSWDRNRQEWERTRLEWERSQQWRGSPRARMRQRGSVPSDPDNTPRKGECGSETRLEWERSQQWRGSPRARMRQRGSVPSDPDNTPRKARMRQRGSVPSDPDNTPRKGECGSETRLEWERSQQWRGSPRARMRQRGSVPSDPDNTPRKGECGSETRLEWERSQQWRGSPRARMRQRGSVPSDPDNTPRKGECGSETRLEWERSQQWRGSPRARMRQRGSVPSDPDNTPRKGECGSETRLEWERSQQWRGSPRARMRQRGSVPSDPDNTPRKGECGSETRLEWERSQQWRGSPRARMRQRGSVPSDPDNTPRKGKCGSETRLEWERSQQWRGSPRARMRQRGSVPSDPDNTPRKGECGSETRLEWERSQQWRGSPRARMRQRGSVPSDPDNTPRKGECGSETRLEWERSQQWRGSPRARMRQRGSVPSDPDNTPRKGECGSETRLEWERSQQWRGSPRARMRQRGSVPSDPDNTPRKGECWSETRLEWERSQQWRGSPRARMRQRGSVPSDPDNTPRKGECGSETRLEWERSQQWRGSPRARMRQRGSVPSDPDNTPRKVGKSPRTPLNKRKENSHLPAPTNLTKSRSHESQLAVRPDEVGPDVSDPSLAEAAPSHLEAVGSPPASPAVPPSPRARPPPPAPDPPPHEPPAAARDGSLTVSTCLEPSYKNTHRTRLPQRAARARPAPARAPRRRPRRQPHQHASPRVPPAPDPPPHEPPAAARDGSLTVSTCLEPSYKNTHRTRLPQRAARARPAPARPPTAARDGSLTVSTCLEPSYKNTHRTRLPQRAARARPAPARAPNRRPRRQPHQHASPSVPPAPDPRLIVVVLQPKLYSRWAERPLDANADHQLLLHEQKTCLHPDLILYILGLTDLHITVTKSTNNNIKYTLSSFPQGSLPYSVIGATPRSPRTPVGRCMAHDIAHRFAKTFNMIATCDYCDKQMLFGSGLKCKECKFKCHRDCEPKVPPSCGLPVELVHAFRDKVSFKETPFGPTPLLHLLAAGSAGSPGASRGSLLGTIQRSHRHKERRQKHPGDDLSNSSSCNSSTPSSPALVAPSTPHHPPHVLQPAQPHKPQFHFPEVKPPVSSPNHVTPAPTPARIVDFSSEVEEIEPEEMAETNDALQDSLDANNQNQPGPWPRQNSLSLKEWDIPYDELILLDVIGKGRFGTVYRGCWHGAVAVKLLHVQALSDHAIPLDTFKHEVATFRKTRHENLVLFMGACMKPPRLAIVTSLCGGMTLHMHIHLRKDKFNPNKSLSIAQQITQGMGYLHARGILHKDLRTKNIFVENGRAIITDFGLFSVTKLCFGNNARGDSLGIPPGWLCYLAPELMRALRPHTSLHLPFSKQTDVYAFGTVWYELLCLEFPFKGQPAEAIIWQVGKGVKQALGNMSSTKDVKDMLMSCWAYQPPSRPDFASLLASFEKLPRKRLARSPSHPVNMSRSAEAIF
ncbi:kinase suppressor of Ras 2-like [Cydia pomonella]|uniref:kinase suppressor of Ras 2-like n=1 Tax=Cydia pomonella TaxID=82600 RepID=UPI002ADD5502|nr:kinase suppressor of Ras 2-like [Cydia pomonella]